MICRCHGNCKNSSYRDQGITVCDEWRNSFESFQKWALSSGYSHELVIDRENTYGNYEPSNCRWVTKAENARNRTNTIFILYKGKAEKLCDLCRSNDIPLNVVYSRLKIGWDIEKALSQPIMKKKARKHGVVKSDTLKSQGRLSCSIPYKKAMGYE